MVDVSEGCPQCFGTLNETNQFNNDEQPLWRCPRCKIMVEQDANVLNSEAEDKNEK